MELDSVISLPNVTVIPVPLITMAPNVLPALFIVAVASSVIAPLKVYVIPAERVMLPDTIIATLPAKVPVNPVQLIDLAPVYPAAIVQVPVDKLVKKTSSPAVGELAPPAPPDVVAHLVPAVPSQFAVPPTQYLSAMSNPHIADAIDLDVLGRRFLYYRCRLFHGLCRRGGDNRDPVVPPLFLHGLDLVLREGVIIRQMQGIPEHPVRGVKLEVDLDHDQASVKIAPGVVFENLTVNVSPSASVMLLP
jgi:hypothetical protein